MHGKRIFILCLLFVLGVGSAWAFFPFDFSKKEIKTDYSQTVWDRMMMEQSVTDMRRGMGEMSMASYQAAANSFAKAIIKNPKDALPHFLYGASLYWSGKVDDAMSEYREGLRLAPQNAMGYQLLGIAWGWKGNIAEAQANFLKATQLNPLKADSHMNLGSTYAAQRQFDQALDSYRRAVELAPREPLYHYQLGTLYDLMGRDNQAEESYKKALKYFSRYEDAQLALAALYEKRDRMEEALKYYKKAVKTKPGDFVARLRYSYLLMRLYRTAEAREVLEPAFSIAPFKSDGLALNAVYRASGQNAADFEKQIEKFKQNLRKVPAGKDIQIEVSLDYQPATPPQRSTGKGKFAEAYETLRASTEAADSVSPMFFQRNFVLNATNESDRATQINQLTQELVRAATAGADKYHVNMTLQGRTMDYNVPTALTEQRTTAPKAVYDPRIVGNDMGLWVMGKTWVRYVAEIQAELRDPAVAKQQEYLILQGLADLLTGQAAQAEAVFAEAHQAHTQDILPLLGLGTAAVIQDQETQGLSYYKQVLQVAPTHKVATRNIQILESK